MSSLRSPLPSPPSSHRLNASAIGKRARRNSSSCAAAAHSRRRRFTRFGVSATPSCDKLVERLLSAAGTRALGPLDPTFSGLACSLEPIFLSQRLLKKGCIKDIDALRLLRE